MSLFWHEREDRPRVGVIAGLGVALIGVLMILGTVFGILGNIFGAAEDVSGDMRQQYERFYNQCASVQSLEAQRDNLEEQLEEVDSDDDEYDRLRSSLTGVKSQRERTINQYNSEASQITRSLFQGNDLPERIDPSQEHTTCGS